MRPGAFAARRCASLEAVPPPLDPPGPELPESRLSEWERRVACAEINSRRVNEAIERGRRSLDGPAVFICECGRIGCTTKLTLSIDAYEQVRSEFDRFLVAGGHEVPALDVVQERCDGYLVVAKDGEAGELARRTDEREDGA
jgi:hypothetical protein